jgi:membrane associated rhomboid family serine protease
VDVPGVRSVGQARPRVLPARPGQAAIIIATFTGVLYLTEAVDILLGGALEVNGGIRPRHLDGLDAFFARSPAHILLAVALFVVWGGVLWGVLPGTVGVSWQGHLFGALGGLIGAKLVAHADRPGTAGRTWVNSS